MLLGGYVMMWTLLAVVGINYIQTIHETNVDENGHSWSVILPF